MDIEADVKADFFLFTVLPLVMWGQHQCDRIANGLFCSTLFVGHVWIDSSLLQGKAKDKFWEEEQDTCVCWLAQQWQTFVSKYFHRGRGSITSHVPKSQTFQSNVESRSTMFLVKVIKNLEVTFKAEKNTDGNNIYCLNVSSTQTLVCVSTIVLQNLPVFWEQHKL